MWSLTRQGRNTRCRCRISCSMATSHNQLMRDGDMLYVPRNDAQKVFVMGKSTRLQPLTIGREE